MPIPFAARRPATRPLNVYCFVTLIAIGLTASLGTEASLAAPEKTTESAAVLKAAQEAALSTRKKLRSGMGTGTYEVSRRATGEKEFQVALKAKAEVCFDGDKYNVKLEYEKDDVSHMQGRIIIFDGTTLIINAQSNRIRPKGAEARTTPLTDGSRTASQGEFQFDPSRLGFPLAEVTKRSQGRIKHEKTENDVSTYTYELPNSYGVISRFDVAPLVGHHITAFRATIQNDSFVGEDRRYTWKRHADFWYVDCVIADSSLLGKNGDTTSRCSFRFEQFTPNARVPAEQFRLEGLKLPEGARILHAPPGKRTEIYQYQPTQETQDVANEGILAQLKTLPRRD